MGQPGAATPPQMRERWYAEFHRNGGATIRRVGDDATNERGAIASLTFGRVSEVKRDGMLIAAAPAMRELLQRLAETTVGHSCAILEGWGNRPGFIAEARALLASLEESR